MPRRRSCPPSLAARRAGPEVVNISQVVGATVGPFGGGQDSPRGRSSFREARRRPLAPGTCRSGSPWASCWSSCSAPVSSLDTIGSGSPWSLLVKSRLIPVPRNDGVPSPGRDGTTLLAGGRVSIPQRARPVRWRLCSVVCRRSAASAHEQPNGSATARQLRPAPRRRGEGDMTPIAVRAVRALRLQGPSLGSTHIWTSPPRAFACAFTSVHGTCGTSAVQVHPTALHLSHSPSTKPGQLQSRERSRV
jgi:hypothetical protein